MSGAESAYSPVQPAETGVGAERTATPKSSRGNTPPASLARVGSLDPSRSASMLAEAAPHMEPLIGGAPRKSWTQQAVAAVARLAQRQLQQRGALGEHGVVQGIEAIGVAP